MSKKTQPNAGRRWLGVLKSIVGAFLGVQSSQVLEQDFQQSSPLPFVIVGIFMALVLIISLALTVSWVLNTVS